MYGSRESKGLGRRRSQDRQFNLHEHVEAFELFVRRIVGLNWRTVDWRR